MSLSDKFTNLRNTRRAIHSEITEKLDSFKRIWESGSEKKIFLELCFCLMTPQSNAERCWETVLDLYHNNHLFTLTASELSEKMKRVRFRNNKARYLTLVRERFLENGRIQMAAELKSAGKTGDPRDWLVKTVKGFGLKEAGHFLRNIGYRMDYAILDRHILNVLADLEVIDEIPASMTLKHYLSIESRMNTFSEEMNIPMAELDLLFWYKKKGSLFK